MEIIVSKCEECLLYDADASISGCKSGMCLHPKGDNLRAFHEYNGNGCPLRHESMVIRHRDEGKIDDNDDDDGEICDE